MELACVYEKRGLDAALALKVAEQLMINDALKAHARDELGFNEITAAKPLQAAFFSAGSFIIRGALLVLLAFLARCTSWNMYNMEVRFVF